MQLKSGCLQPQIFVKSNYFKTKGRSIMRLGQKIAALHKKNHLFQEALAEKMNVSRQAVSNRCVLLCQKQYHYGQLQHFITNR